MEYQLSNLGSNISSHGLENHDLHPTSDVHWNYPAAQLVEQAVHRGEGHLSAGGALVTDTGHHTGRSPNDKFTVEEPSSKDNIWWGSVNRPISASHFSALRADILDHLNERELFVFDGWAGAHPAHRLPIRVVTQNAWHALFAQNMFIVATPAEQQKHTPEFTVLHAPSLNANPEKHGTKSETAIVVNFGAREVLICGTQYAGEIKKSIFSVLNYQLPDRGVMPMHSSINIGSDGHAAIFFGLSGTGKTTLSADPHRTLIGDDEHGWSDDGVFNFEGGCYAKVINLSPEAEPEIHATTQRFGTILENVVMHPNTCALDLEDESKTENTRASYPLSYIPNASPTGIAGQPKNVVMLTADAFGVLPPIARLTPEQAMYHFLSGYTARVAGTERGVTEPQATFSACFGAPFMPRHPSVYAKMLGELLEKYGCDCWLVNTGWTGGAYGTGHRMPIKYTRALLSAALDGNLAQVPTVTDPLLGLFVPESCPGVPNEILTPRETWPDKGAYDETAGKLVQMFTKNFGKFEEYVTPEVVASAPKKAA
jgi:phosphoenolpyruvate carboxykinase (ATP)